MRKLALTAVIALSSGLAFAAGETTSGKASDDATTAAKPAAQGAGDAYLAKEFWDKHAKGGFLTKDDAMQFRGADGKGMNMQKLDSDSDGRISEREWATYHETAGAAGIGAADKTDQKSNSKPRVAP